MPSICLNMIVRNESKIITRLFDSVLPVIDSYCICDTGSTDNTIDMIKSYFESKNINGEIFTEPFKNFGYNRNLALQRAKKWGDYILLLDADMILKIEDFKKSNLTKNVYSILQKHGSLEYYNIRLVKSTTPIICVGVTHEHYKCEQASRLHSLRILDVGDGGCKADKFERDIRLLSEYLVEHPDDPRTLFYLANSYRDLGNNEQAIATYKKRIEVGGWKEEVWSSYLSIGRCQMRMGNPDSAVASWLFGFDYYPKRAENIYEIVRHYRETSKYRLASHFINLGKKIPYPRNDILFIEPDVYDYLFDFELSIIAYYIPGLLNREDIEQLFNKLIKNKNNKHLKMTIDNYNFYNMK